MEMVFVPAGKFVMGSPDGEGDSDEHPHHMVHLHDFWIDRTEVTNGMYAKCVESGSCSLPGNLGSFTRTGYYLGSGFSAYPVIWIFWEDASAYCEWAGRRLPTEAEWEKAARGTDGRTYPWGFDWDPEKLNSTESGPGDTTEVGSYPAGASPYGALDMAGNVWEWVADWYDSGYYSESPESKPTGPESGSYRVLRGGSWHYGQGGVRAACRHVNTPEGRYNDIGFRCARSS